MKYYIYSLLIAGLFFGCSSSKDPGAPSATCPPLCGGGGNGGAGSGAGGGTIGGVITNPDNAPVEKGLTDVALVNFITFQLIEPELTDLSALAFSLKYEVNNTCAAGGPNKDLKDMRVTWESSMKSFHRLEAFLFGPLLTDDVKKFGDSNPLKNNIYTILIPEKQKARIDKEIAKALKQKEKYDPNSNKTIRGLDALEYVLFSRLAAESELTETSDECWYLKYVTNDLKNSVDLLRERFAEEVTEALEGPSGVTKIAAYLSQYTQGLVDFADKTLKDRKVGVPLGLDPENLSSPFPCTVQSDCHSKYLEHQYHGKMSREAVVESLKFIEKAFGDPDAETVATFGFNAYLNRVLDSDILHMGLVNQDYSSEWLTLPADEKYFEEFGKFDPNDPTKNKVYNAHTKIKELTTYLKTDFITDMNVKLPGSVQGDTD